MDNWIQYGVDYLRTILEIVLKSDHRTESERENSISVARIILVMDLDFSVEDQNKAINIFFIKVDNNNLEDLGDVLRRLVNTVGGSLRSKEKLILHLFMMAYLDGDITQSQVDYVHTVGRLLDFRQSELNSLSDRGIDKINSLTWFAENYI